MDSREVKKTIKKTQAKIRKKENHNEGFERFLDATDKTSELVVMILRVHLLIEYYLDQILIAKVPRGDLLTEEKFSQKIKIVQALSILSDKDVTAIKGLNSVRNRCSHELNYEVGEEDIDKIGKPYGVKYIKEKKEYFSKKKELLFYTLMTIAAHLDADLEDIIKQSKPKF